VATHGHDPSVCLYSAIPYPGYRIVIPYPRETPTRTVLPHPRAHLRAGPFFRSPHDLSSVRVFSTNFPFLISEFFFPTCICADVISGRRFGQRKANVRLEDRKLTLYRDGIKLKRFAFARHVIRITEHRIGRFITISFPNFRTCAARISPARHTILLQTYLLSNEQPGA
jgi:hypothetical protein